VLPNVIEQLLDREPRFRDDLDDAQLAQAIDLLGIHAARQPDYRDVEPSRIAANALKEVQPVHLRHHHVEQDQVGPAARHRTKRLDPVGGTRGLKSLVSEKFCERFPGDSVIIDDKNQTGRRRRQHQRTSL
jgi:hypothetical protein